MRFILLLVIVMGAFLQAKANPVTFTDVLALQGSVRLNLLTHPDAVLNPMLGDRIVGNDIMFCVHTWGLLSDDPTLHTLRFTLDRGGQLEVFDRELFWPGTPCCNDFLESATFSFVDRPYVLPDGSAPPDAILYNLNVEIVGGQVDPNTYSFYVVKPIPEISPVVLLLTGLIALILTRRSNA